MYLGQVKSVSDPDVTVVMDFSYFPSLVIMIWCQVIRENVSGECNHQSSVPDILDLLPKDFPGPRLHQPLKAERFRSGSGDLYLLVYLSILTDTYYLFERHTYQIFIVICDFCVFRIYYLRSFRTFIPKSFLSSIFGRKFKVFPIYLRSNKIVTE